MGRLSGLFIAAALLGLAAVDATSHIPLKRNKVSMEAIRAATQNRAIAMHQRAFDAGAQPAGAVLKHPRRLRGTGAPPTVPMFNDLASGMYVGEVAIGTPEQKFSVVYDTGSSNLWVPDTLCNNYQISPSCAIQHKFDNKTSSTFVDACPISSCFLFLPYGSGTVLGFLSTDTVTVGGLKLPNTSFGRVTTEPGNISEWNAPTFDGILGLAYPLLAMPLLSNLPAPFDEMMSRKLVPKDVFSVYLSSNENDTSSYVAFGSIPRGHYEGAFITANQDALQPLLGYWCVAVTGIKVGSTVQPGTSGIIGVVDTGTSLIAGPPAVVNPIIAQINASTDCSNLRHLPNISFTITTQKGDMDFVMTPEQYTYRQSFADGSPDQCQCGLFAFDAGEGLLPLWILGDPFIRTYFTVFDRGQNLLHFAKSKSK